MSTYTPISSVTLSSAQSSVTFSGIPQTYTDLIVVLNGYLADSNGSVPRFRFNLDSATNYSQTMLTGTGTTAKSSRGTNTTLGWIGSNDIGWSTTAAERSINVLQVMDYSNLTTNKTTMIRTNQTLGTYPGTELSVNLWRSTAAVTSITIYAGGATTELFAASSTFSLYGIDSKLSAQAKAYGGDTITTDGTYWYHTFYSSSTLTPTQSLSNVDFLVVGGGGGGYVQGGGAGGYRTSAGTSGGGAGAESKLSLTANAAYTITIGAGGTQGNAGNPGNGSDSSISGSGITTITSTGGGGVSSGGANGNNGGSGAGAFNSGTAGTGSPDQGFGGGSATTSNAGGGGGGAGSTGQSVGGSAGGNGGNGVASSITGSSITRAGGGAGYGTSSSGTAGTGGGGTAGSASPTSDGGINLGGGGGGNNAGNGGRGGSGVVVIRYTV